MELDIDAMMRDAQRGTLEEDSEYSIPLEGVMKMLGWRLLVVPLESPKKSKGGIIIADEARHADQYLTHMGKILDMGAQAFKARTEGGLCLADDPNIPKVGDIVLYAHNAGIRFKLKDGRELRILSDTNVLAVTERPQDFRYYL